MVFIFHKLILLMIYVFSYGHLIIWLFASQRSSVRWTCSHDCCIGWMWAWV